MAKVVLDTSVLIALAKNQVAIDEVISSADDVILPTVVIAEFLAGIELMTSAKSMLMQLSFLDGIKQLAEVSDFGEVEARAFGLLEALSVKAGTPMSEFDLVIAAHAVVGSAVLITRDKKAKFSELPGVVAQVI